MAMNPSPASIPALVLQQATANSGAIILRKKDRGIWKPVTWSDLVTRMRQAGSALKAGGFRSGDVAGVLAETRPEWVTADLGILSAGGVSFGIPPSEPAERVSQALRITGCRTLFVENEEQLDKALAARESCPALQHIVIFDMTGLREFNDPGCESFANFLARGEERDAADRRAWEAGVTAIASQHPAVMLRGFGMTDSVLTHADLLARIEGARGLLKPRLGDERLALMPMCDRLERIYGLYYSLATGTVSNYLENPETALENMQELQPTVLGADAATWSRLHDRTQQTAASATIVQRTLYKWGLAAGRKGGAAGLFARLLVLNQVRRELGLARLRLAYIDDPTLTPEVSAWAAAIGVRMERIEASAASPRTASPEFGAMPVEA